MRTETHYGFPSTSRYEFRRLLGHGAAGVVYEADDVELNRRIALKTLRSFDPEQIYRLKKEFRTLARISHPNLIQLYDLEVTALHCFFTMELVSGVDIVAHVRERTGPGFDRLRQVLRQLVAGLGALHERGMLHRDIKPANVLVEPDGRCVVLDFGLVTRFSASESLPSRDGVMVGTLAYMAPEQIWGEDVTTASDWYSVGVILFEVLTGRLPARWKASPSSAGGPGSRRLSQFRRAHEESIQSRGDRDVSRETQTAALRLPVATE